jgi:hypothetical protein
MFSQLIAVITGLVLPTVALAAPYHLTDSGWNCQGFLYCGSGTNFVAIITVRIVQGVTAFIGALAVVVFVYGALRMVTSQGQEGKDAGKKALIWASVGLFAAVITGFIIQYVRDYIYLIP